MILADVIGIYFLGMFFCALIAGAFWLAAADANKEYPTNKWTAAIVFWPILGVALAPFFVCMILYGVFRVLGSAVKGLGEIGGDSFKAGTRYVERKIR